MPRIISLRLTNSKCDIYVGLGILNVISNLIPADVKKIGIVTQENIKIKLNLSGHECHVLNIVNSESAKSLSSVSTLCSELAVLGFHRNDLLIALGGGVVTDLVGFVASVYNRGIRFINVPTTLLAQVDASIGGKTGVNLPEGKNLVGSFYHPICVVCDVNVLRSLPEKEIKNGFGEIVKYSLIANEDFKNLELEEIVYRCAKYKAEIVQKDEYERLGIRSILNYGHTLGHAIEQLSINQAIENPVNAKNIISHGNCVAIGIAFATALAVNLGRIDSNRANFTLELLKKYDLLTDIPKYLKADVGQLISFMYKDKKSQGELTFILDGPTGCELVKNVSLQAVKEVMSDFIK